MIYMTGDGGVKIIILESQNLDEMRKGRPAKTPDGTVLIAWTPDPVWLADKLMESDGDPIAIGKLIDEAGKRPEKPAGRKKHPVYKHKF